MTRRLSRISSLSPVARHNLAQFINRQMTENDIMRARIYDTIRARLGLRHVTADEMLSGVELPPLETTLLDACAKLIAAHQQLLQAHMLLVRKP